MGGSPGEGSDQGWLVRSGLAGPGRVLAGPGAWPGLAGLGWLAWVGWVGWPFGFEAKMDLILLDGKYGTDLAYGRWERTQRDNKTTRGSAQRHIKQQCSFFHKKKHL